MIHSLRRLTDKNISNSGVKQEDNVFWLLAMVILKSQIAINLRLRESVMVFFDFLGQISCFYDNLLFKEHVYFSKDIFNIKVIHSLRRLTDRTH